MQDVAAVILAAGEGTRMRSDRAKVLHEIAGVPMIRYVVQAALAVVDDVVVVIGHQAEAVRKVLAPYPTLGFAVQKEQLGTGHAVLCAMPLIQPRIRDVVVLCGDTPLIKASTVRRLVDAHKVRESDLTLLITRLAKPSGYGRIIIDGQGKLMRIVEEADASESEKRVGVVNTGTYCIHMPFLESALADLKNDNAQGEFYLTDVVEQAYRMGRLAVMLEIDSSTEVIGVNTKAELAEAERLLQRGK
ncbi:MAG: NTP transferase domain-containing protein [Deltaproteobacteria bacterium]|nr:NTP transferase domain-containing protein [Deltaproteobacteria bacterium]